MQFFLFVQKETLSFMFLWLVSSAPGCSHVKLKDSPAETQFSAVVSLRLGGLKVCLSLPAVDYSMQLLSNSHPTPVKRSSGSFRQVSISLMFLLSAVCCAPAQREQALIG